MMGEGDEDRVSPSNTATTNDGSESRQRYTDFFSYYLNQFESSANRTCLSSSIAVSANLYPKFIHFFFMCGRKKIKWDKPVAVEQLVAAGVVAALPSGYEPMACLNNTVVPKFNQV